MPGDKPPATGASGAPEPSRGPTPKEDDSSRNVGRDPPPRGESPETSVKAAEAATPWWKNPAIAIPTLLGIVGILVSTYLALHPRAAPDVDPVTQCLEKHPDARVSAAVGDPGSQQRFSGCLWPPIPGSDSTGYWTVGVQDVEIPGSYAAQEFTTIQVFTTSCFALTLDYVFDSQGTVAHSRFTVDTQQTVSGYDGQNINLYSAVPDPPKVVVQDQDSHLIVLINLRYALQRVRCADSTGAPPS